jgi:hypothetical protein
MATNTQGTDARKYHTSQVHYLRQDFAYNTTGIGTTATVKIGTLPAGAIVEKVQVKVTTAFNAGTTNQLDVGVSGNDDSLVDYTETDVDLTATGSTFIWRGADETFSADTPIYVKYTETGTAASAGAATVIVFYTVDLG